MFIVLATLTSGAFGENQYSECRYKHVAPNGAKSFELLAKSFELILMQWSSNHRVLNKFVDISMQFPK
jgi:hypothetical protein